jgi:mono/diheme cytochrome c family protein
MKTLITLILILVSIIILNRCYYDSEEFLFPDTGSTCDTLSVTYSQSVVPIIQNNCISCHGNSVAAGLGGNVKLQDYADVKLRADDGKLVGTISHAQGYVTMPQGAPRLNDCTISTVRIWVEQGAQDN